MTTRLHTTEIQGPDDPAQESDCMPKMKHVVLLRFNEHTTPSQVDGFFLDLKKLGEVIPGIVDFAGGPYSSWEGLNQGYSHGFVMTFESAAARDAYLPHPEHEKVKDAIIPHVESIVAFDFEA
jgi:hypothetical protein